MASPALSPVDYAALASFRLQLRRFVALSERLAHEANLEPQQHQLLLALRGLSGPDQPPTIGNLAEWLSIRHHSAVELVDRAAARGLVRRQPDARDRRRVLVELTPEGEAVLDRLSTLHWQELRVVAPALMAALRDILGQ